jgi:hypothetical protein
MVQALIPYGCVEKRLECIDMLKICPVLPKADENFLDHVLNKKLVRNIFVSKSSQGTEIMIKDRSECFSVTPFYMFYYILIHLSMKIPV